MSFNTFGKIFRFTTWGESHGPAIGCIIDGCPPNIPLSEKDIQKDMDRRRPGQSKFTTQRKESDKAIILSGVFEGKTTGTPISIIIHNEDKRSRDYETIKNKFRPGHADYTYFKKYGIRDFRGGGRQSARETACRVAAGAVAKIVLKKIIGKKFNVIGAVTQLGLMSCDKSNWKDSEIRKNPFFCPDKKSVKLWEKYLLAVRKSGSSCGAIIELRASGVPVGLGAPRPTGTPVALSSIIAPHDEPAFLTASRYFSQSFTDFLSGQKNGFFLISLSFQFDLSQDIKPNCVTAPITLNFLPIIFFKTTLATAPAATLLAVSLAD